jgi:hypothetical protein
LKNRLPASAHVHLNWPPASSYIVYQKLRFGRTKPNVLPRGLIVQTEAKVLSTAVIRHNEANILSAVVIWQNKPSHAHTG